jgi:predicted O-methyltransferase YrrM
MLFEEIERQVRGIPYMEAWNARYIYDLILDVKPLRVLELGVAHGTSTCYMAAAIEELGAGKITAVDLIEAADLAPTPEELLARTGLADVVELVRMQTGYTWFLHDEIRAHTIGDACEPVYDLCVIDGPKNWTIDGAAFFMVDKLLKPAGYIVFDDYLWSYADSDLHRDVTDGITHRSLSDAERETPQIREVFELLVKQHPDYGEFDLYPEHGWAIAQKVSAEVKRYTVRHTETYTDVLTSILVGVRRVGKRVLKRNPSA